MDVSGVRSSWLTVARKSVLALSSSRSCCSTCNWALIRWPWMRLWARLPATCWMRAISALVQSRGPPTCAIQTMPRAVSPSPTGRATDARTGPRPDHSRNPSASAADCSVWWSGTARTSAADHSDVVCSRAASSKEPSVSGSLEWPGRHHWALILGTRESWKVVNQTWSTPRDSPKPRTRCPAICWGLLVPRMAAETFRRLSRKNSASARMRRRSRARPMSVCTRWVSSRAAAS